MDKHGAYRVTLNPKIANKLEALLVERYPNEPYKLATFFKEVSMKYIESGRRINFGEKYEDEAEEDCLGLIKIGAIAHLNVDQMKLLVERNFP